MDEDFADVVAVRNPAPTIVWVKIPNTRKAALLSWFEPLIDKIAESVDSGSSVIELR